MNIDHSLHQDVDAAGSRTDDRSDGYGDLSWAQSCRGHLVKQRLKKMMITLVNQSDLGIGRLGSNQFFDGSQTTKPCTNDDNVVPLS